MEFYFQKNGTRYKVITKEIETDSNYNTSINITKVGEKTPFWGTIIKPGTKKHYKEISKMVVLSNELSKNFHNFLNTKNF